MALSRPVESMASEPTKVSQGREREAPSSDQATQSTVRVTPERAAEASEPVVHPKILARGREIAEAQDREWRELGEAVEAAEMEYALFLKAMGAARRLGAADDFPELWADAEAEEQRERAALLALQGRRQELLGRGPAGTN